MAGTGVAARAGILIRDAEALEGATAIRAVAFDKTGTLTEGKPRLVLFEPSRDDEYDRRLAQAASLQAGSEHPLAGRRRGGRAGIAPTRRRRPPRRRRPWSRRARGGPALAIGSAAHMGDLGVEPRIASGAEANSRQGRSVSFVADVTDGPAPSR